MSRKTLFLSIVALPWLAGCAAGSVQEIRHDPVGTYRIEVAENYQAVYRRVADAQRACFSGNVITAHTGVEAELYDELRLAETTLYMDGVLGRQIYMLTEFRPAATQDHSVITFYYSMAGYKRTAEKTAAFIQDGTPIC